MESAQQSLLDFDLGESSDDSDFRIEDHCEESDDDSVDSNDGKGKLVLLYTPIMKLFYILFLYSTGENNIQKHYKSKLC